ncbi:MAG: endonuclease/exonuclease/phosphatase family protein [Ruminiclostridium sp.]|nr:endonuclease/exonuclease/phosphatase family protein [Ruminiclostridium sp.]
MKIMTLNTHSLIEENYPRKLCDFVSAIRAEKPHIIALQEVNQTASAEEVSGSIRGYVQCSENAVIRSDNHVYKAAEILRKTGTEYYWTWLPVKRGYDKYDEGIAVMSLSPILETDVFTPSRNDDYGNWKTRKIIGVRTEAFPDEWFFSVHFGWWNDEDDPFGEQWIKTCRHMKKYENVWLMGDFNCPAEARGEGYDMMTLSYWHDSFVLAEKKHGSVTVSGRIDGWDSADEKGMRIDQIWCRKKEIVTDYQVIFDGSNYPVVSDHYGVMIDYERSIV